MEVMPASLVDLDSLTVEDDQGARWTLDGRGKRFDNFSPSHLREHMVQGLAITVRYHEEGEVFVIDDITD